jgi:hypothetical protein
LPVRHAMPLLEDAGAAGGLRRCGAIMRWHRASWQMPKLLRCKLMVSTLGLSRTRRNAAMLCAQCVV